MDQEVVMRGEAPRRDYSPLASMPSKAWHPREAVSWCTDDSIAPPKTTAGMTPVDMYLWMEPMTTNCTYGWSLKWDVFIAKQGTQDHDHV